MFFIDSIWDDLDKQSRRYVIRKTNLLVSSQPFESIVESTLNNITSRNWDKLYFGERIQIVESYLKTTANYDQEFIDGLTQLHTEITHDLAIHRKLLQDEWSKIYPFYVNPNHGSLQRKS